MTTNFNFNDYIQSLGHVGGLCSGPHTVDAALAVGDVVYISASGTCAKAKADAAGTMPAIGIIVQKPDSTTAIVQTHGPCSAVSGLTAGTTYYVSPATAGLLTATEPTTAGQFWQPVGVAITSTLIHLE
jgi:hypothetical protein